MKTLQFTFNIGDGNRYFCSHSPDRISHIHTLLSVDALKSLCPFRDQLQKQNWTHSQPSNMLLKTTFNSPPSPPLSSSSCNCWLIKIEHMEFVNMFKIYQHTKLHMPITINIFFSIHAPLCWINVYPIIIITTLQTWCKTIIFTTSLVNKPFAKRHKHIYIPYLLPTCCTLFSFVINYCFDIFQPQFLAIFSELAKWLKYTAHVVI